MRGERRERKRAQSLDLLPYSCADVLGRENSDHDRGRESESAPSPKRARHDGDACGPISVTGTAAGVEERLRCSAMDRGEIP